MSAIIELVGPNLTAKGGAVVETSTISGEGKVIGLYFSAHWCPPCRGFTPKLADWYNNFKKSDKGDKLEIIFVSSDRDDEAFNEYFGEMPWHALPFDQRDKKAELGNKFGVRGIPMLVFVNAATGEVIDANGRGYVDNAANANVLPTKTK